MARRFCEQYGVSDKNNISAVFIQNLTKGIRLVIKHQCLKNAYENYLMNKTAPVINGRRSLNKAKRLCVFNFLCIDYVNK